LSNEDVIEDELPEDILPPAPPPKPHKTKKALPDRRELINETWRERMMQPTKFDDSAKGVFLQHYGMTKRMKHSAMQAGVCFYTVKKAMKDDAVFKKAVDEMAEYYKDHIHEVHEGQMLGIPEPIMGGKFKDVVVGWKTVFFNNNHIAMELKRTNPEYNEKTQVDMNVTGGVLVAPASMPMEEYIQKNVKMISKDGETKTNEEDA